MNDNLRIYRRLGQGNRQSVQVCYKESDLEIHFRGKAEVAEVAKVTLAKIKELRNSLEGYADFASLLSLTPVEIKDDDPRSVKELKSCAMQAGVGPLAGVAGFFAKEVGEFLLQRFDLEEVLVENGGDLFLAGGKQMNVYLPGSQSDQDLRLKIDNLPMGVATSSGKFGPSFSKGRADRVCVIAKDAVLADCLATAYANRLASADDLQEVLQGLDPRVLGFIACIDGSYAIKSDFEVTFC